MISICLICWLIIGFFTALVDWKYGNQERIIHDIASRKSFKTCRGLLKIGKEPLPEGFMQDCYKVYEDGAKGDFFFTKTLLGPIGPLFLLISCLKGLFK